MRRIGTFHPPTDYYNESLTLTDKQICELIAKRKELSGNNPGFPDMEKIAAWCVEYGLNEEMISGIFTSLYFENKFRTLADVPKRFIKFIPILKSVVVENAVFVITHMKQYENASVVFVEAELDTDKSNITLERCQFELSISPEYQCRMDSGSGRQKGVQYSFAIFPSLPDDVSELEFTLTIKPFPREEIQPIAFPEAVVKIK